MNGMRLGVGRRLREGSGSEGAFARNGETVWRSQEEAGGDRTGGRSAEKLMPRLGARKGVRCCVGPGQASFTVVPGILEFGVMVQQN